MTSTRNPYRPSPYNNLASRSQKKKHNPITGFGRTPKISEGKVEKLIYGEELKNPPKRPLALGISEGAIEARRLMDEALRKFEESLQQKPERKTMTVSLYSSTASGKEEIVVQTNALSLDLYISGLADALSDALDRMDVSRRPDLLASLFRNAFPVAFSIAGYKAEKVVESRMLVCGAAAPGESNLLAHSRT